MGLFKRLRRRLKRKARRISGRKPRASRKRIRRGNKLRRLRSKLRSRVKGRSKIKRGDRSRRRIVKPKHQSSKRPVIKQRTRGKISERERRIAFRKRDKTRLRKLSIMAKANQANDQNQQKLEEKIQEQQRKMGLLDDKKKTITSEEELVSKINIDLRKTFQRFGKSAPSYKGTIGKVISDTQVQMVEPFPKKVLESGWIWRDFNTQYSVRQMIEIPGSEIEEKDLAIGELEYISEHRKVKLEDIAQRSEELVSRVVNFLGQLGFLSGSLDETALLSSDTSKELVNVKDSLNDLEKQINIKVQHSASLAALHHNPAGCKPPGSLIDAPPVIPVFEFYDPYSDDYHYSTNFEWPLEQEPGVGWINRTQLKGGWHENDGGIYATPFRLIKAGKGGGAGGPLKLIGSAPINLTSDRANRNSWQNFSAMDYSKDGGDKFTHCYECFWKPPTSGRYVWRAAFDDIGFVEIQQTGGSWKRLINKDYSGWSGASKEFKVSEKDIKKERRYGFRWAFSEFKGAAAWQIQYKNLDKGIPVQVDVPITKKVWRKKWWKGRKTVITGYKKEKRFGKDWSFMPAKDLSLAAPNNYKRSGTAFGAYDPMLAEHKNAEQHVKLKKWSSFKITDQTPFELSGRKNTKAEGGSPSSAGEAVGKHYIGKKPPSNHAVKKDDWTDLGSDFAALKADLPVPHPDYREVITVTNNDGSKKEVVVEEGKTLPVHRFYNKEKGTFRFKILPDGRTRQARTTEGVLKTNEEGIPIMEKMVDKIGTENTFELAGQDNGAAYQQGSTTKLMPASNVGEGFEWQKVAFYAFEPPGIPANVLPEVQIDFNKKQPDKVQVYAGWKKMFKSVTLNARAVDTDGKIIKYRWKLLEQKVDVATIKSQPKNKVIGHEATIKMDFPLGRTKVEVMVEDNRGDQAFDKIDVIVLPPSKNKWASLSESEWKSTYGSDFQIPYTWRKNRRWRRDKRGTSNHDINYLAYKIYQQGYKDKMNGEEARSNKELQNYTLHHTVPATRKVKVGRKKKFKLWRGNRWVDVYKTESYRKKISTSMKKHTSHKFIIGIDQTGRTRRTGVSMKESDIDNKMKQAYDMGYRHGGSPFYMVSSKLPPTVPIKLNVPRRRKPKSWRDRLRAPKAVRNRIKKAFTVPKKIRNKIKPPKKVRKAVKKAARKLKKFFRRWSDYRLKKNINHITTSKSGINVYEYNYIWGTKRYRGVMAQELLETHPEAVGKRFGYYTVDYNEIDVNFERVDGR